MDHTDFIAAFEGGRFRSKDGDFEVVARPLGRLQLPSGRVTACDPLSAWELEPLARRVPAGEHEVWVAVATLSNGDARVAAALLRFAPGAPLRWELATREGEDPATLEPGKFFGYGVDAGTGCFADGDAARDLSNPAVSDRLGSRLQAGYQHTWSWANLGRVVAFSSGWGDGSYASFWGFGAGGKLVALATDFGVLMEPEELVVYAPPTGPFDDPRLAEHGISIRATARAGAGPVLEIERTTRSIDVQPWTDGDQRAPVAMSSNGDMTRIEFETTFARVRISVLLRMRPLTRG